MEILSRECERGHIHKVTGSNLGWQSGSTSLTGLVAFMVLIFAVGRRNVAQDTAVPGYFWV